MIRTFADSRTRQVFARDRVPEFSSELQRAAWKKLAILHAAGSLQDLRVPPAGRRGHILFLDVRSGRQGGHGGIAAGARVTGCAAGSPDGRVLTLGQRRPYSGA
jgi:hypothetical protein